MNIDQITKDYEDYKKGLEQALHEVEDYKQKWREELIFIKQESLKMSEKLQEESGQSVEEWEKDFEELYKSTMIPYTCVLPLLTIISHFVTKASAPFPKEGIDLPPNPSVREIYRVLSKLPENTALLILDSVGIGFLIDVFRDGEDGFASAFASLDDKTKIMDELIFNVKTFELGACAKRVSEVNDENTLEAVKFYLQGYKNSVRAHPDYEYLNSLFDANLEGFVQIDNNSSSIIVDESGITDLFRKLLLEYIKLSPDFDPYTQACADKILNNPEYIEFTSKLLAECKEELKRESICKEKPDSVYDGELLPLPFPYENVKLKEAQKESFLAELYELLLNANVNRDKPYIQTNKKELFVYLFGGFEAKPVPCTPIIWLRQKNELQAFLLALYGNNAGNDPGWAKFNNYFWWKTEGISPQLANNSGNISEDAIVKLNNLLKPLIVKYAPDQD